jgi:hypothetical protein
MDTHPTESGEGGSRFPTGRETERLLSLSFLCGVSATEPTQGFAGPGGRDGLRGMSAGLTLWTFVLSESGGSYPPATRDRGDGGTIRSSETRCVWL